LTNTLALDIRQKTASTVYYGWVNVAVAALAMVATLPGRTYGLGLITEPLLKSLNIDREQFAAYNGWATFIGSSFCLACGPLIDRFGARAVLTAILAALGGTVLAMSRVTGSVGLLITLVLSRGFGQSALSVVSLALVGKWFSQRLPMAMGVYAVLVGLGFAAAFPGVGFAVISNNPQHWRVVWGAMGWVFVLGLAPLACLLSRRSPESVGLVIDGLTAPAGLRASDENVQAGHTLAEALESPAFWACAVSSSVYGMISSGLMLFNEAVLKEHGFDKHLAVSVTTVVFVAGIAANLAGGWLAGKWAVTRVLALAMALLAASLCCLPVAHGRAMVFAYALLMGISGGFVTVAFFACWGKLFGRLHLGSIQGAAQGLTVVTASAGPWLLVRSMREFHSSSFFFCLMVPVTAALAIFCALSPLPTASEAPVITDSRD
jgi:MFS family permease